MTTIRQLRMQIEEVKRQTKALTRDTVIRQVSAQELADLDIGKVIDDLAISALHSDYTHARDLLSQVSDWLDYAESAQGSGFVQPGSVDKARRNNPLYPELILKKHKPQSQGRGGYDPLYPERG